MKTEVIDLIFPDNSGLKAIMDIDSCCKLFGEFVGKISFLKINPECLSIPTLTVFFQKFIKMTKSHKSYAGQHL